MTWIKTIAPSEGDETLREALGTGNARSIRRSTQPRASRRRRRDSIVASHTLIPDALHHAFATFGALMSPDLPLTRRQHEMITTSGLGREPVPLLNWTRTQSFCVGSPWTTALVDGAARGLPERPRSRSGPRDARLRRQADEGRHARLARATTSGCARSASTTAASCRSR